MRLLWTLVVITALSCSGKKPVTDSLFSNVTTESGIDFRNDLTFTEAFNPYTYRNFFNGAGVGMGDINNDGLLDVYLAGNQVSNRLYLNEGNLKFRDITEQAGVSCNGAWSTGITFVDINADGFLDIYVCKSGSPDTPHRSNELFINNGDLTFSEKSKEYGLDVVGLSVQAAFFDYDKDGDLDCYLLTNSIRSVGNYDLVKDQRNTPDPQGGGNKFFVNENGKFQDKSVEASIYRSNIGFGLGITLGDFNSDTWTDIFVSNDFFERDYLYINDKHGAFKESLTEYFQSISMGSMGADWADLDNDGQQELFVTEMLPDSLSRRKTKTLYESWDKHQMNVENGYYNQFPRNVLQKRIGDHNYAEIGRLAGISATEWSWGALLFDMDNDGMRDIFVANGIFKDLLDRDYLTYTGVAENVRKIISEEKQAILKLIELMPTSKVPNYAFKNEGHFKFNNRTVEWGLGEPNFSSGSAYGDLDNDGDLDLMVSNCNAPMALYRNNSDSSKFRSVTISLTSTGFNTMAVGSKVGAYCGQSVYVADNFVTRGFQSSVQPFITIGLGEGIMSVDSVLIEWPDGGYSVVYDLPVNRKTTIERKDVKVSADQPWKEKDTGLTFQMSLVNNSIFRHMRSEVVDFNRNRLLPMMYSNESPALIKGDINKDGVDEVYVGGGKDQTGMFIDFRSGKPKSVSPPILNKFALSEETKGALVDIDGDGDLDFYMATGGRFFSESSGALVDPVFLNNGKGDFTESPNQLPFTEFISTSVGKSIDFDKDGDADLVVGERFKPFAYGTGGRGYLFENDGKGSYKDVTARYAPALQDIGMITDIESCDFDGDGWMDMILVGDWMPIVALRNDKGNFADHSQRLGLAGTEGWWHEIASADLNKDGKTDFVIGNHGLNTFFKSGDRMYVNDFDRNGSVEQIFCTKVAGQYFPIVDRDEFLAQLPSFKKQLLYYRDYGTKSIADLFGVEFLDMTPVFQVNVLSSVLLLSYPEKVGAGPDDIGTGYQVVELPQEAQFSPIYALSLSDFDGDGVEDIIAGGNQYLVKPQFGRSDASSGWFFKGAIKDGKYLLQSGVDLNVKGEIRAIEHTEAQGIKYILFAKNDGELEIYKISR